MGLFDMKLFRFLGFNKNPKAPWSKYYSKEAMECEIPDMTMYKYFANCTKDYNDLIAITYFGKKYTYNKFRSDIDICADAFLNYGIRKGDVVTICMPNTPEAMIGLLALNKIGAISNMVHPLSSVNEIKNTILETRSVMLIVIDMDYDKIKDFINETDVYKVILVKASNSMPLYMKPLYKLTIGRKYKLPKASKTNKYVFWNDFVKSGLTYDSHGYINDFGKNDPAVMLHSGGSTGTPKAIVLSNGNFIALSKQSITVFADIEKGDKCLSIMPVFHGFGLGVCIYTPFCLGAECIFIPTFKANEFDKILTKHKPEFVIGVPTLFEALLKIPEKRRKKLDFRNLKYAISGGDSLKESLVRDVNKLFKEKGAKVGLIQGYGMSESLAAVALEKKWIPKKDGTIGIPFPGCYIGIFDSHDKEVKYGKEGEICISGPNVMLGYYNNEKETNLALHIHKDGNVWLHSGDIGVMDKDGYITYKSRLKRLIISSGYNVYPSQIEELLENHPAVMLASAIGVPHPYKQEVVKVYIVLNKGYKKSNKLTDEFKQICKDNLPKYAWPYNYEYRDSLPRTMIGKVDFKALQDENNKQREKEKSVI